ncbi:MAG: sulfite exporter TauE/SafE family protein, partial [Bacteroidota bacterium]
MEFTNLLSEYSLTTIMMLVFFSFTAGFIDSIVGGGGFIQLPALLINFPQLSLPTLMGTNKIAGFSGTFVSAIQYGKRIKFDFRLLLFISIITFLFSYLGASVVSYLNSDQLKPVILLILIVMAIYTFIKKDLGQLQSKALTEKRKMFYGVLLGAFVGFYDGFFG